MRGAALPIALVLLLAACEEVEAPAPTVPPLGALNRHVLAVVRTYPRDGTHAYHWPREGAWLGFTRTLTYDGEVLGEGDAKGRCYCCGLTFEVFFRAWERWCREAERPFRIGSLDAAGLRRFVGEWFGSDGNRETLHAALTRHDLGVRIEALEDARAGDFVQLWRHSGSGHSVVFLDWVRNETGRIEGLRYWSTQSKTRGIGEREERFGEDGASVKRDELYVVRVGRPAETSPEDDGG